MDGFGDSDKCASGSTSSLSSGSSCQDSQGSYSLYATFTTIAAMPLLYFFIVPWFWRAIGSALGWYLKRKTEGRRAQLLEIMNEDERRFAERGQERKKSVTDEEWESIETLAGSADNGGKGAQEWDGIVGFFHPFWCVFLHWLFCTDLSC